MADEQPEDRAKKSSKAAGKKAASKKSAKKDSEKKSAAEQAPRAAKSENVVVKKISARKPIPIKTARVGKRAILPRLPPPQTVLLKARNQGRRASRLKYSPAQQGRGEIEPSGLRGRGLHGGGSAREAADRRALRRNMAVAPRHIRSRRANAGGGLRADLAMAHARGQAGRP